jgi:GH24 family phage-related lysozyme (muramidase)
MLKRMPQPRHIALVSLTFSHKLGNMQWKIRKNDRWQRRLKTKDVRRSSPSADRWQMLPFG